MWAFAERQNHAREMMKEADLSQWDALVIMSGDGLLFEVRREIRIKNKEKSTVKVSFYQHRALIERNDP